MHFAVGECSLGSILVAASEKGVCAISLGNSPDKLVKDLQYVMMEVNTDDVYVGCAQLAELDTFLSEFRRVETYMVPNQGWGDALWIRL